MSRSIGWRGIWRLHKQLTIIMLVLLVLKTKNISLCKLAMKSEVGEERDAFVQECDLKAVIVP